MTPLLKESDHCLFHYFFVTRENELCKSDGEYLRILATSISKCKRQFTTLILYNCSFCDVHYRRRIDSGVEYDFYPLKVTRHR